jgi:hypothetical protein
MAQWESQKPHLGFLLQEQRVASFRRAQLDVQVRAQAEALATLRVRASLDQEAAQGKLPQLHVQRQ